MQLRGRWIFPNGELGRLAHITGTFDRPKLGTIYEQAGTEFTNWQAWQILLHFHKQIRFDFR